MDQKQSVREVQGKILEIMKYIDSVCRKHHIVYFIMGGTALGAVRHGGFIPWDDDLDIFMTPAEYSKFKTAMKEENNKKFVIQEWRSTDKYLEYAKVRMNGTTFIEEHFKNRKDMHQGIYVDIMMLHKVPADKPTIQKEVYYASKFVTLYGLTQRNWKPKTKVQAAVVALLKILPCKVIANWCYKQIYKYENLTDNFNWCYWITPAKFHAGIFNKAFFENPIDIPFEDTTLLGSSHIKEYLTYRYGDYMKLPSAEQQKAAVHAMIFDINKNYTEYIQ
jgi:lipopolysaccharide cholinephosphotransferase